MIFFTVSISFVLKAEFSLVIWINISDIDLIWNSIQLELANLSTTLVMGPYIASVEIHTVIKVNMPFFFVKEWFLRQQHV